MAGGPVVPNQAKLDGLNPLAYLGVRPSSPPQLMIETRDPGINDYRYVLGTLWLNNNSPYNVWILVNVAKNIATWLQLSSGGGTIQTLTSNTGGAISPTAGNINVVGDGVTITGAGNPGTSTITFSTIGSGVVSTLTGNSGGAVGPALGNINVVGSGLVNVVGNPGTNTLTISDTGAVADSFPTDSGTAVPSGGVLNVLGGTAGRDINTSGSGDTIHIDLKNSITLGDLSGLGNSDAITCTTGNITLTAGRLNLPATNSALTQGTVAIGGFTTLHTAGSSSNIFVGDDAGNGSVTGTDNAAVGFSAGNILSSGTNNTMVGYQAGNGCTTGSNNINIGKFAGVGNGSLSQSSNIYIGNTGTGTENNTLRLGTTGSGAGQQSNTYIAGINTVNVGSVASVVSISGDHLGSTTIQGGTGITVTPGANTITIAGSGTVVFTYTNVNTTPYVVLSTDEYLSVDCSGGAITVELPNAAPSTGRVYYIKDRTGSAATHNITVTTVGGAVNIDGATTFVMNTAYESINVLYNGSTYEIF